MLQLQSKTSVGEFAGLILYWWKLPALLIEECKHLQLQLPWEEELFQNNAWLVCISYAGKDFSLAEPIPQEWRK